MSPFLRQIMFSCGSPERDPVKALKESGAKTFQERLSVLGARRLTKTEIREQYSSAYADQLLDEVMKKQKDRRASKTRLGNRKGVQRIPAL